MKRWVPSICEAALNQLVAYDWPGNVRQLQNVIERSIILWQGGPLAFDIPVSQGISNSVKDDKPALREQLKRQERDAIANAIRQTNGRVFGPGGAAELLGMKPTTLASRISALGLNRKIGEMGAAASLPLDSLRPLDKGAYRSRRVERP